MSKSIKLFNGHEMPILGLGTWLLKSEEVQETIRTALSLGYRHFDCAWAYLNEKEIGIVLEKEIHTGKYKREDLFITSKLWNSFHRPKYVEIGFHESLTNLKLDYLDLFLIHWPISYKPGNLFPNETIYKDELDDIDLLETWKAMESLVDEGKVRSIGVSNFNIRQLQHILDHCRIRPAVNQIEIHVYLPNKKLVAFCLENNIQVTAYSPLGGAVDRPNCVEGETRPLQDPEVLRISKKLGATPGQILLSYIMHRNLICVSKSNSPARLAENMKAVDIKLTEEDFHILDNLNIDYRMVDPSVFKLDVKNYPFGED